MRRVVLTLVAAVVSASLAVAPLPASAQSDDAAYCAKLADLVVRYLGKQILGENRPDAETLYAIDRCQKGDTATGIPILERKLRNGDINLPAR
jgi:hypothetical protein